MNLLQVVKHLQGIALTIPNIRSANEGSVYTIQNGNPHQKYMSFVVSQTTHRTDDLFDYFGLNLFLIDRLTDELEANRLQIQSLAKDCLTNILIKFCNKFYGATYNELVFHPFTEKFTDLCAGQYVQVTLQIPRNIICEDEYSTEYLPNYTLKPLVVEITENGVYEYEPDNFDGYDKVTVTVNVDIPDNFESGFTSGVTYQKSLLSAITITENGEFINENGVSAITVDVSGYTQDDLDDAYQSGITYQKSLLSAITIDHNGEFINENGYSAITVNVPQTGESIYNQSKSVEYTQNGEYIVNYDNGYTGLEAVNININVPQSAYTSGYTQEDLDNAYQSGITYQKSLLSATAFTENGYYTSFNGYSGVTVDVDTNAWYQSGKTDQKALLSAITINENGLYTNENGYSAITVDVSGYTQEDLDNAYQSGITYCNGILNIIIESDDIEGLVNVAGVQITYSGISTTYIYTGGTISVSILPGVDYQVMYLRAEGYSKPTSFSFTSKFQDNLTYYGYYQTNPIIDYSGEYLTFDVISGGTISWAMAGSGDGKTIEYSKDNGTTWTSITSEYQIPKDISVESGDLVLFKGINDRYFDYDTTGLGESHFRTNDVIYNVYGNIMSMLYGDNFSGETTLVSGGTFGHFFHSTNVINANNLILPATTLKENCYESMFLSCSTLTTSPELPAQTLTDGCYAEMFSGCTNLKYVKCLATDINATNSTRNWLASVSSTGTFTKAQGVTWPTGSSGIPDNWTVIEN